MHLSVIIPVFKAPQILNELVFRLEGSVQKVTTSFEIILVDDGCPWDSWTVVEELAQTYTYIKGLKLSRNFGQHYAISAGLNYAKGEWIVVMDCDLQDDPEDIIVLYHYCITNKLDLTVVRSVNRNQNWFKNTTSKLYRRVFNFLTDADLENGIGNFGIYNRQVVNSILSMGDAVKVFPVLAKWVGFNRGIITLDRNARNSGKSSYTFMKLIRLSLDMGLAFSDKILKIGLILGLLTSVVAFSYAFFTLNKYFNGGVKVAGYTSVLITVLTLSGMLMTFLGVLGLYISKIFQKVKDRPSYIISKLTSYE